MTTRNELVQQFNEWTPGRDHNQPRPIDLARERVEALADAGKKWAVIGEVTDPEVARRLDDYINQLTAEAKRLKAEAATEKAPHKVAIDRISGAYRPLEEMLAEAKLLVLALAAAYLRRQREALAAAGSTARPRIRGSYSARARTLREHYRAEVDDVLLCFVHYRDHPAIKELLTKLASHDARDGRRDIPGCTIIKEEIAA